MIRQVSGTRINDTDIILCFTCRALISLHPFFLKIRSGVFLFLALAGLYSNPAGQTLPNLTQNKHQNQEKNTSLFFNKKGSGVECSTIKTRDYAE